MIIQLTVKQRQQITKKYVTYSYPLNADITGLLQRSNQPTAQAFWQSADGETTLLALAPLQILAGQSMNQVKIFQDNFRQQWVNLTPAIKGQPVLIGGFPFDFLGQRNSFWQAMDRGYLILPQILVWQQQTRTNVTLLAVNDGDVEAKLNQLAEEVALLLAKPAATTKKLPTMMADEVAVDEWLTLVKNSVTAIKAGKLKKVVLARQLALTTGERFDANQVLQRLMTQQPNTYHFLLASPTRFFVGATPERLLKADLATFQTASVAGSIARGKTPAEDDRLGQRLINDHKNEYEHQVVVDRITWIMQNYTHDLIVGKRQLLKNRDIQHLFHPFIGQRNAGVKLLDVLTALHPTPALGGEPRTAALKWLAANEPAGRGLYGGPIGWLGLGDDCGEFAVGLRSGVFSSTKGFLYAGCGIVSESQAEKERQETGLKFRPMLRGVNDQWIINKH